MKLNLFLLCFSLFFITQCFSQINEQQINKSSTYNNENWPQYMGPNMNAKVKSEYIPSAHPEISWEFEYDGGTPTPLVVDKGTTFFGTESKNVYAIDSIGNLKWKVELDSRIKHSPLIYEDILVVAPDSTLIYGINALNGNIIWKREFSYEYKSYISDKKDMFGRTIVTDPDKFTIKKMGQNEAPPFIDKGQILITTYHHFGILDIKTGKTQSSFQKNQGKISIPLITDDAIYTTNRYNKLFAYNKGTGKLKWETKLSELETKPILYKDTIYTSSYYYLNKIDKNSGEDLGAFHSIESRKEYDIIDNETYYLSENGYHTHMGVNYGSHLNAFDISTGEKKWDFNIPGKYITELIMVGDYIYFGDSSGNIRGVHKITGEKLFGGYIGGSIDTPLSYANGKLYGAYEKNEKYVIFAVE